MSFLRPHTVNVWRVQKTATTGLGPYGADEETDEIKVFGPVRANISEARQARPVPHGIPGAAMFRGIYLIVFRCSDGIVQTKDIVIDQNGNRYQAMSVTWGRFGVSVMGELMEV